MARWFRLAWLSVLAVSACGSGTRPRENDPTPIHDSSWTYYAGPQGLSQDVHDVSADEGGNVYVAGGDALYVKRRGDTSFLRFDASNGGLTRNCNDPPPAGQQVPPKPMYLCPVISVAGMSPGKAIVGLQGLGVEADVGVGWVLVSGGADVVAFDGANGSLSLTRHVQVASPPHVVCGAANGESFVTSCPDPKDNWWLNGRRLLRQVFRIVVNHDTSSPMYGDAWMGGNHGTFSVLLANTATRRWTDRTAGWPGFEDARDVWEHLHPSFISSTGLLLIGEGWALSLDPRSGVPWGSNGVRTAWVGGYGADLSGTPAWWMEPWTTTAAFIDLWKDSGDEWLGPTNDHVRSMSHCPDGTLWIGSTTHGLARIEPDGATISYPALPAAYGPGVSAIACDPSDSSVWIGLQQGGVVRLRNGSFEAVDTSQVPAFARNTVASIQIDPWSNPRVVYFAFSPARDASGNVTTGGGVASYDGT